MTALSGEQLELRHSRARAVVASVGASLRHYSVDNRDLVLGFAADEVRPSYRGALLAPWPNRIVDGRYTYHGRDHQLALTEPARRHALHGLLAWQHFTTTAQTASSVTLSAVVEPQAGYPWRLTCESAFDLTDDGLIQTVAITNHTDRPAPVGLGVHPYLVAGPGTADDWALHLPASTVLHITDERLIPTHTTPVTADADRFDYRQLRPLGPRLLDHAFTDIDFADGHATARLLTADGSGVAISWDTTCGWVQVYTSDDDGRIGVAIEPMTCAPNAFNESLAPWESGLWHVAAGEHRAAQWTIRAVN